MFNSPIMIWVYAGEFSPICLVGPICIIHRFLPVAGILLSVVLSYTYLTYERMHLVTIEQADAHQPYDYIIGSVQRLSSWIVSISLKPFASTHSGRRNRWLRARQPPQ